MAIFDTFSKRKKRLEHSSKADFYQYDVLPLAFRVQVIHIWDDAIGAYYSGYHTSPANEVWDFIHNQIAREHGQFVLHDHHSNSASQCRNYLMNADAVCALDIIEFAFKLIDVYIRDWSSMKLEAAHIKQNADDAIEELNHRFQEHRIGYQYLDRFIIRVDSQLLHAEVVKPALALLNDAGFGGPSEEFIHAFDHYRKQDYKAAVAECLKAFESTMKAICTARKWAYPSNATAAPLVDLIIKKGLIPPELASHFGGLRSAMESGLPTISNPNRHGQGAIPVEIPPHFAAYALHLTASNIVFLMQAHKASR